MYKFSINNKNYDVKITNFSSKQVTAEVNGQERTVSIREIVRLGVPKDLQKTTTTSRIANTTSVSSSCSVGAASGNSVNSPIPGQVKLVLVKSGDAVNAGQKVLILEAMKLENEINATQDGIVKNVLVSEGDTVIQDQILIEME